MSAFNESSIESLCLSWLSGMGYSVINGLDIAPGEPAAERKDYHEVVLAGRLRDAVARLNPHLPAAAHEEAVRKALLTESPSLVANNRSFHRLLTDGVFVEVVHTDGHSSHEPVRLIDFENPDANDWLAVNQYTVIEGQFNRRPDVVLFVNGLPLAVIELKNPTDENATLGGAWNQLQTYKQQIPSLFTFNEVLIISDGLEARVGSLTAPRERFVPWRTIEGDKEAPAAQPELEVMVRGLFDRRRFLDFIRHFVVFEETKETIVKKIAAYHQFHAVRVAVGETVKASAEHGDRRIGVIWHTQGSGKSLTMVFYAGKVILESAMRNPTVVMLTDRNDLDDQLFGTFAASHELLRQKPIQADSRADLREKLKVASGGVIFTTIQKFLPEIKGDTQAMLSDRTNIVVIADEAHRSQYDFIDGYARHMREALPNASFVGFTGTPLEQADKNTRAVFGDYISVYDIQQAVRDKFTVPIYYESRLAKLQLDERYKPLIDQEFEEATEGEEVDKREKLKTKWAALESVVGANERVSIIASDLVEHFENRLAAMDGKAMIVAMSRRIAVDLYNAIVALRPDWHDEDDSKGVIKVVMTGSATDPLGWQQHIRNKPRREELAKRFKKPKDPFKIVIVRDMWLTGFDAPCMHTMYLDKPMRGHGLMQAIARVNRVFSDKPGGLVVDYLGLADNLRKALSDYTDSGGSGSAKVDQSEAVAVLLEKLSICRDIFHGFDYSAYLSGDQMLRLGVIKAALEFILDPLKVEDGETRLNQTVTQLSQAFALSVPNKEALAVRDEVAFFQAIKAALGKRTPVEGRKSAEDIELAIRQIVSNAVASSEVIDIFTAAGLNKPDISILSDEFLVEVRGIEHRNLALEALKRLLNEEIKSRRKVNLVQARSFSELLEKALKSYTNRALTTVEVIEQLIELARQMKDADKRGEALGLSIDEMAFYTALETNDSAVAVLGDEILRSIALELKDTIKKNTSVDWTVRESVRAKLRVMVKKVLKKHGYPPDKQERAAQTVLEQAELMAENWAG